MKRRIALTLALFVFCLSSPFAVAGAKCGMGACQQKAEQKQECDKSAACDKENCDGCDKEACAKKQQGCQGQADGEEKA